MMAAIRRAMRVIWRASTGGSVIPYPGSLCTFPEMRLSFVRQMVYNIEVYEMGLSGQVALLREAKAHRR
jgi:hypothetical protein